MKRITVTREYIAEDFVKGALVYDQCGGVAFVVTDLSVSKNSVTVFGKRIENGTSTPMLTDYTTMFVYGDTDVWLLND